LRRILPVGTSSGMNPTPPASDSPVRLRPHHVLCALGFEGRGYSDGFTANMAAIVDGRLRAPGGGATEIVITAAADAICAPCPKRRGAGCVEQPKIDALDARHGAALGLAPGDRLTWAEALDRVRARVRPGDLARLCAGCSWLAGGMCEDALARLHREGP
jgi:hypothetical protein